MKINWLVRLKNKNFWLALVPALMMLVQVVASIFEIELPLTDLQNKILSFVNVAFSVLVIMGVVNDPTTQGLSDSKQALTYDNPK